MEDENLLDEEILVQETQDISPTTFTRNLVNWLGFSSQQHRTETVNITNNNNTYPKGVTSSVPLKISDAPKDLQDKWTSILKDCTKQLTMILVKFHQGQTAHQEQLAETLIHNASHIIIPEYITTVPDITSKIESSIEELMCETSLIDKKFCKRPHPTTKTKTTKKTKMARSARLYMFKKLHKNPMGIRPIVSSCESPTENISQYVDFWLQPLMKAIPSFLKEQHIQLPTHSGLLYRDFRCLIVTFHFVQVVCFNILLYLHCCFYTCVYRTQLCLLCVYIEVYIVILARISCYASPTTKNGGLHTPIVGR